MAAPILLSDNKKTKIERIKKQKELAILQPIKD